MNISAERFTATFKYDELWINKKDISKVELIEWLNGMKESVDSEDVKSWYEILIGDIERLFPIVNERKDNVVNDWISVESDLPPTNTVIDGYNKKWIDEDFNPEGIRECFLQQDVNVWNSAKWDNDQDCWDVDNSIPTHWKQRIPPIESQPK